MGKWLAAAVVALLTADAAAQQAPCPRPPEGSYLYVRGYQQVELVPMEHGWWKSWWLAPSGDVRVVAMQPRDDGSGCFAWHLLPQDSYTIEDLIVANEGW